MNTPNLSFVGPVLLTVATDVEHLRCDLVVGLEAAGIVQPDPKWMARFEHHVRLSMRQGEADHDADLAVGEFMLWLGHRLHLGHGMLIEPTFVQGIADLVTDLVDRGLVRIVQLGDTVPPVIPGVPTIRIDHTALHDDPARCVRIDVLDHLGTTAVVA